MQIDIRTATIEPIRHTFGHVARRLGGDKPASRYLEGTLDLQATANFHYRPLWAPEYELFDERRSAIKMKDWYAFKDPRQYYYAAYTMARARQQDAAEKNFDFVEKRDLLATLPAAWRQKICDLLLPLRHVEWGANMNNCSIAAYGYGTAITQAALYNAMDRLGIAQYLSRIGLLLDGNQGSSLEAAKAAWLNGPHWQPMRRLVEDSLVVEDWFELLIAQDFVMDALVYPLVYNRFEAEFSCNGGTALAMLTEFMLEWYAEVGRWMDATIKIAAQESEENRAHIAGWVEKWRERTAEALAPLAERMFASGARAELEGVLEEFDTRASALGLKV